MLRITERGYWAIRHYCEIQGSRTTVIEVETDYDRNGDKHIICYMFADDRQLSLDDIEARLRPIYEYRKLEF